MPLKRSHRSILVEYGQYWLARTWAQRLWEPLYKIALLGLNVSGGSEVTTSGEKYVLRRIAKRRSKRRKVIFDVGANTGDYAALVMSELTPDSFRIYAFEPSASAAHRLRARFSDRLQITIECCGLSDASREATLYVEAPGSALGSLYERHFDYYEPTRKYKERIRLQSVDKYCREKGIRIIDLLKLDVEGHDLAVLKGARKMIAANSIRAIQFEIGYGNINSKTYLRDFFDLLRDRYVISRILKNGLREVKQYHEIEERFLTTNFFAELRR